MIYTITLNPSIDYHVSVPHFQVNQLNRIAGEDMRIGGKGVNVSVILHDMGIESICLGFVAGFTGRHIEQGLQTFGCKTDFVQVPEGFSRVNIKLDSGVDTNINGIGPVVTNEELEQLLLHTKKCKPGDYVVLAGSMPHHMPENAYDCLLSGIDQQAVRMIVDADGQELRKVIGYRPFLIKATLASMSRMFAHPIEQVEDVVRYAQEMQNMGARNILVGVGLNGGVLLTEDGQLFTAQPSIGSGDVVGWGTMIAGFIRGYQERENYADAFGMALKTRELVGDPDRMKILEAKILFKQDEA